VYGLIYYTLVRVVDDATTQPTFFVEWKELDVGGVFADTTLDLGEEFALMRVAQFSKESTELNAL